MNVNKEVKKWMNKNKETKWAEEQTNEWNLMKDWKINKVNKKKNKRLKEQTNKNKQAKEQKWKWTRK